MRRRYRNAHGFDKPAPEQSRDRFAISERVGRLEALHENHGDLNIPQPLTRPAATLSPSDGERDGVRGNLRNLRDIFSVNAHFLISLAGVSR